MRSARWRPYALAAPAALWLVAFFVIPLVNQLYLSLETGDVERGFRFDWHWGVYADLVREYHLQMLRSVQYAAAATALALVVAFPMVYFIAFHARRSKQLLLLLIALPLLVSFVLRTTAWQAILADDGTVADALRAAGLLSDDGRLLATPLAVIAGITYNFLPFMALPLYATLEGIDRRLIEAGTDLYASRTAAFVRITLPLAWPGILAGSLVTFVPALGDYVNAQLLGSTGQTMIGNVVQSKFLVVSDYPGAAALGFMLMCATAVLLGATALLVRGRGRS